MRSTGDFYELVAVMARLRGEGGCEWDRAQSHDSLRQYLVEETHEVLDAISRKDPDLLCEELGDLLLQVLFHARLEEEAGRFSIGDVIRVVTEKMVRRHPHVFGDAVADTPEAVVRQWEAIKETVEKRIHDSRVGGVPVTFPSLLRGAKITRKAARAGFDWESTDQVLLKVEEELRELREALPGGNPEEIEHELGDVLFSLVNLSRFLHVNPETAMISANSRFERRFREMEKIAAERGIPFDDADMEQLDRFWEEAKRRLSR
jgi:tetrapyrrole methylase family protein/MazG family protein